MKNSKSTFQILTLLLRGLLLYKREHKLTSKHGTVQILFMDPCLVTDISLRIS